MATLQKESVLNYTVHHCGGTLISSTFNILYLKFQIACTVY